MGLLGNILNLAVEVADRLPLERVLIKHPDDKKDREELKEILKDATPGETPQPSQINRRQASQQEPRITAKKYTQSKVSTEETIGYQNREIAKNLLMLEKHYAQKLRINNKVCDCGQSRHLLAIESLCEETISMADEPDIYYRLIDWVRDIGPKSTVESAESGVFESEYPQMSQQARDFRKEIIGSLDTASLWPNTPVSGPRRSILPLTTPEERQEIKTMLKIESQKDETPEETAEDDTTIEMRGESTE